MISIFYQRKLFACSFIKQIIKAKMPLTDIKNTLEKFNARKLVLIRDDSGHEKRSVLVTAAKDIQFDLLNEMVSLGSGLLFVALNPTQVSDFNLSHMPLSSKDRHNNLRACVSVEARQGVSTGISIADRVTTIRILGEDKSDPKKLVSPGHIFPVEVNHAGVLAKNSLAEGAYDFVCNLNKGLNNAAVFSDLLDHNGNLLSLEGQEKLSLEHNIPQISLSDIIRYRLMSETLVSRIAQAKLPTKIGGDLVSYVYKSNLFGGEHLALIKGNITEDSVVLTRVQPEYTFADVFGGGNPPSRKTLLKSLEQIEKSDCGVLIYLRRPEQGQLTEQVSAWSSKYSEKPAAVMREYGIGAQILSDIGVRKIELLTNSKKKLVGLNTFGIEIVATREIQ